MKLYVIRETSGYPTVVRNGQTIQIGLGDQFTEDELATLVSDTPTTYLCLTDNIIYAVGWPVAAPVVAPVVETAPAVEEAADEAVVPSSMETGSKASKA